jgi:hypothetical protein
MRASPDAHNAFVRQIDERLGGKLKPLIRFAKAWKCYRQVPISSFYLELRVASFMRDDSSIIYDIDLNTVFRKLCDCGLAAMQDPMGISGHIPAAKSAARLADARSKLETAASRAEKARAAAVRGAIAEAFDCRGQARRICTNAAGARRAGRRDGLALESAAPSSDPPVTELK